MEPDTRTISTSDHTSRKAAGEAWLSPLRRQRSIAFSARILVFPYAAGGATSMRPLVSGLPASVDLVGVTLPGRERRFAESLTVRISEIIAGVCGGLADMDVLPTYFLGHSMGANLALAVALSTPASCAGLIVSGRMPRRGIAEPESCTSVGDPLALLVAMGNTNPELLEDPFWRKRLARLLRHDCELDIEATLLTDTGRLHHPILALGGTDDPFVNANELSLWANRTSSHCEVRVFPGDHFYLFDPVNRSQIEQAVRHFIGCG